MTSPDQRTDRRRLLRSAWKRADSIANTVRLRFDSNPHSRWLTYSWIWSWVGRTVLRADYVRFTAARCARNVLKAKATGVIPGDWNELKYEFHYQQLIDAGFDD